MATYIEDTTACSVAEHKGWQRIQDCTMPIKIELTSTMRIDLGNEQSKFLIEARKLEGEKKTFDTEINNIFKTSEDNAYGIARDLKNGYVTENRDVAICLDPIKGERVYLDHQSGDEVMREPMRPEDKQLRLV